MGKIFLNYTYAGMQARKLKRNKCVFLTGNRIRIVLLLSNHLLFKGIVFTEG
ncbi:MAG: hypothetical protein WAT14_02075 [Chitinophagaceae bacterium]|nr:hypothetical protein [Chitinophagaceae bacterium]